MVSLYILLKAQNFKKRKIYQDLATDRVDLSVHFAKY